MSFCKKVILILFAFFLLVRPSTVCAQDTEPKIYLEGQKDSATGLFILKIMLRPQNAQLCGLELDITYDPAAMLLCSCERGDALSTLEFDCSLGVGRIRLLLWGGANSEGGGRIATICFMPADNYDGETEFSVSLPTKSSAIYFEDGKILSQNLLLQGLRADLKAPELSTDSVIEYPTESPSVSEQETPSAELPTEEVTEKTEPQPNVSSDPKPPKKPLQNNNIFKKILNVLLCINTGAGLCSIFPLLLPRVFRKGYF